MSFAEVTLELLKGFAVTCQLFILTLIIALPLGLLIAFGSMSRFLPLRYLTKTFVWVIRGTPLMLQVIAVFYVPGLLFDLPMSSRMLAVLIAFVINYACYFSEIYRGGIESISKGQYEAGQVLGLTKTQIFFKIILFQVIKRIIPPMSNEIITLVKDTSLARVIAVEELTRLSQDIVNVYGIIWPLFYAGVFYLVFNGLLSLLFGWIEKKMDFYKG
ncbi:MAG TPA: amino acid ABC transporter permease [Candidatus Stercoripulliclostridium merdipullorum]|uniref:Amino acid ABC transporter permease n=1 Tax=Candidatus Stercoripulliclostridium merdipullorum TaxID=2840952 RepID=A0A9D1SYJ7_9FIRM|nr:amino acid ABC transporter permease [Candidatus Stercoripulliclostridium merdipullorum]